MSNNDSASMLRGHANYIAGAAKEAIGTHISSDPSWKSSGSETKAAAVDEMRAAKANADANAGGERGQNATLGKMEEKVGSVVGCEGMVEEGREREK